MIVTNIFDNIKKSENKSALQVVFTYTYCPSVPLVDYTEWKVIKINRLLMQETILMNENTYHISIISARPCLNIEKS